MIMSFRWGHTPSGEAKLFGYSKIVELLTKYCLVIILLGNIAGQYSKIVEILLGNNIAC